MRQKGRFTRLSNCTKNVLLSIKMIEKLRAAEPLTPPVPFRQQYVLSCPPSALGQGVNEGVLGVIMSFIEILL
jgi:hypothetical protein